MGRLDHAFPYITSSKLHQVHHRPIPTSVGFLLNLGFIMPCNSSLKVQYIGPRCRGTNARLLLKQGGLEAALAVVRRTYFHTKTRQLCWSITQSAVSNFSRPCHSIISDICHSSQGFLGVCVSPGPHQVKKNPS
ncbi:uncharacterized protein BKA55DRAFT_166368 [Fusarium redolens]|uniref:Uncharacterized protein n=1 Tax=Fusarium redolens TaxID=48865 RepID=A0A9P9KRH8_FUSRE|nr:uncharacterized protein BKA55DRAFT_166368 [Fusarium redolens]KAH7267162.1 hypothetical protein BKA55DRAFT_166368 [Fusarium redolens]